MSQLSKNELVETTADRLAVIITEILVMAAQEQKVDWWQGATITFKMPL